MKQRDISGQRFGKLVAIHRVTTGHATRAASRWLCVCDCGTKIVAYLPDLVRHNVSSCGCLRHKMHIGAQFGRLTVLRRQGTHRRDVTWLCQCSCGRKTLVPTGELNRHNTSSCGCIAKEIEQSRRNDMLGKRFGKLVVIRCTMRKRRRQLLWECRCDCGAVVLVTGVSLRFGTRSCGCLCRSDIPLSERRSLRGRRKLPDPRIYHTRKRVLARDAHTCVFCGHQDGSMAVHHVYPWKDYPSLRFSPEACVTMCNTCHRELHYAFGTSTTDPEDTAWWLTP